MSAGAATQRWFWQRSLRFRLACGQFLLRLLEQIVERVLLLVWLGVAGQAGNVDGQPQVVADRPVPQAPGQRVVAVPEFDPVSVHLGLAQIVPAVGVQRPLSALLQSASGLQFGADTNCII